MKRFKFYLIKTVSWTPHFKQLKRTLVVSALDSADARQVVSEKFPDWQVSMFWPEWP
jgi:hypothetical protein